MGRPVARSNREEESRANGYHEEEMIKIVIEGFKLINQSYSTLLSLFSKSASHAIVQETNTPKLNSTPANSSKCEPRTSLLIYNKQTRV